MKKFFRLLMIIFVSVVLFACAKEDKKPYGAEDINYEEVKKINNDGPVVESQRIENTPPMADKVVREKGPWHIVDDTIKIEPTADYDERANDGAVPIYQPEHR